MKFIVKNNLYLITLIGIVVLIYTLMKWEEMPVLQRMVCLFFPAIVLHLWEEGKFPGGFTEMITKTLNFTARNRSFGEIITAAYVLFITLIPIFFPKVVWLSMAALLLGIVESIAHLAAIKMFKLKGFYSPGLVTALVLLLPISIYSIVYVTHNDLMKPVYWLYSVIFMLAGVMIAQQIVVRMSGMKYLDFLKNVKGTFSHKRT